MTYRIVWAKIWREKTKDFVWMPVRYEKIWDNKIHDVEWRSKPPRKAVTIGDSPEEMKVLEGG